MKFNEPKHISLETLDNMNRAEVIDLCNDILDWYEYSNAYDFDPAFVEKMKDRAESGHNLSQKQIQALRNIKEGWVDRYDDYYDDRP